MKKIKLDLQFFASGIVDNFNEVNNGSNAKMQGRIKWTAVKQGSAENYSLCSFELQAKRTDSLSNGTTTSAANWQGQVTVKVGDKTYTPISFTTSSNMSINQSDWKTLKSVSNIKIYHNDDGTCEPTIAGYVIGPSVTSFKNKKTSGSQVETFDTIPRATTLDSFSGNKRIGVSDDVIINFTKKNTSFTTTIEYATTADFSDAVTIVDKSTNANTYSWTIPISLLNKIPNSKTLPIYIRLTTYNGDTQIGAAQTNSFTANVYTDNCRPIWTLHTIEETDAVAEQLVITANKFIANLSKPKFTFEAEGQYGATISYYQINNTPRSSGFIDSNFNTSGYTLKVVDSRGIENTYTFDIEYVPYFTPVFEEVKLFRDVPTSNKMFSFFRIKFFNNTSDVKFDNPQALSYKFNYQESGGTLQEKTIIPEIYDDGTSRYAENETELGNTFNYKKSVDWTFLFVDLTGRTFNTGNTLPMGIPLMNGKMNSEGEQELFVNGKTTFNEDITVNGEVVVNGNIGSSIDIIAERNINAKGYLHEKGARITPIDITNTTTTLLDRVKSLAASGITQATWFTQTDEGTSGINDKPSGTENKGFVCEAICNRYYASDDWRYVLRCYVHQQLSPYIALVDNTTTSITWIKEATLAHPVGSIFITSTNTNPNVLGLSGTWELYDKQFKDIYEFKTGTAIATLTSLSSLEIRITRTGHMVHLDGNAKTNANLTDSTVKVCTLKSTVLGFTGSLADRMMYFTGYSDGGNNMIQFGMNAKSMVLESYDVVGDDSHKVSSGANIMWSQTIIADNFTQLADSYCDKFYWKRIS